MATQFDQFKLVQRWFDSDYAEMFFRLIPKGMLWVFDRYFIVELIQDVISGDEWQDTYTSIDEVQDAIDQTGATGNLLRRLLSCFGSEGSRIEKDSWDLLNETDPGVAVQLLPDWERVLGLPDACTVSTLQTWEERQAAAHAKLFRAAETTTNQWFVDLADDLGFDVTITKASADQVPRRMGGIGPYSAPPAHPVIARMGGATVDNVTQRLGGSTIATAGGWSIITVTFNADPGDYTQLECAFTRWKPAHAIFQYVPWVP